MMQKRTCCEESYSDKISGTEVNYFILCKRRCWLCKHKIMITEGNPYVIKGKILDNRSRRGHEEIKVGRNKIDLTVNKKGDLKVHEYKKGGKTRKSAQYQLLHYLRCLEEFGVEAEGILHNLEFKKKKSISLNPEKNEKLIELYKKILEIGDKKIPELSETALCHTGCSFEEYCWG